MNGFNKAAFAHTARAPEEGVVGRIALGKAFCVGEKLLLLVL